MTVYRLMLSSLIFVSTSEQMLVWIFISIYFLDNNLIVLSDFNINESIASRLI